MEICVRYLIDFYRRSTHSFAGEGKTRASSISDEATGNSLQRFAAERPAVRFDILNGVLLGPMDSVKGLAE
jgi:hypothetical protein